MGGFARMGELLREHARETSNNEGFMPAASEGGGDEALHPQCAGVDVHKVEVEVCIWKAMTFSPAEL